MCIITLDTLLLRLKINKNLCVKFLDNFLKDSSLTLIITTITQKYLKCAQFYSASFIILSLS